MTSNCLKVITRGPEIFTWGPGCFTVPST